MNAKQRSYIKITTDEKGLTVENDDGSGTITSTKVPFVEHRPIYELTIWCPDLDKGKPKDCFWQLRNLNTGEPPRYGVHYDPDYPVVDRENGELSQTGQEFVGYSVTEGGY